MHTCRAIATVATVLCPCSTSASDDRRVSMFQGCCDIWPAIWLGQLSSCIGSAATAGSSRGATCIFLAVMQGGCRVASRTSLADLGHNMALSGRCWRASCSTGLGTGTALLPLPFGLPGCDTTAATCATGQEPINQGRCFRIEPPINRLLALARCPEDV